jgi:hypothetical protein
MKDVVRNAAMSAVATFADLPLVTAAPMDTAWRAIMPLVLRAGSPP